MKYLKYILLLILFLQINYTALLSQDIRDTLLLKYQTIVHFNSDRSNISENEKLKLDSFVYKTQKTKPYRIYIFAHTDKQGSNRYNIGLSKDRAYSIRHYLIDKGVKENTIKLSYFGENQPLVEESNENDRRLNRRGIVKLFKIEKIININGIITDKKGKAIPGANIELKSGDFRKYFKSDSNGLFNVFTPLGKDAKITATAKNFFFKTIVIKRNDLTQRRQIKVIIPGIVKGEKFIAKNLLFFGSRCNLRPGSLDELKHVETSIKLNDNMCFEIAGHINGPGLPHSKKGSFEYELSVSRALAIYDSLINYGISGDRLLAKGYGNWFMIYPKAKEEKQMRYNRRVEIVAKDCEIIRKSKNDILSPNYIFSIYNENFSPKNLKEAMGILNKTQKTKVLKTLRALKARNVNPAKYTYLELLNIDFH